MTKSARHGAESCPRNTSSRLNSNMSRLAASAVQTGKDTTRRAQTCKARLLDPKAVMPGVGKTIIIDMAIQRNATRLTRKHAILPNLDRP
jgi:hypothetical protein